MSNDENEFSHILYEAKMYIKTYRFTVGNQLFTNLVRANHAVHLRNLTYLFGEKKHAPNWHYSDFVADANTVQPIDGKLYGRIMKYCNGAVDHLSSDRVNKTYKAETNRLENEAFPILVEKIQELLDALDESVMQEYEAKWSDFVILNLAKEARELCEINISGGGCVMSGCCQMHFVDNLEEAGNSSSARFYTLSDGALKPVL